MDKEPIKLCDWARRWEPFVRAPLVDVEHWDRPTIRSWVSERIIVWQVIGQRSGRCYGGTAVDLVHWCAAPVELRRDYLLSFLRKPSLPVGGAASSVGVVDKKWAGDCPALFEHMTATLYQDGTPRRTCTLSVSCEDGSVKGGLKDRDQGLVLWASAKTLQGLLGALEGLLTADETPWRVDRYAQPTQERKGGRK